MKSPRQNGLMSGAPIYSELISDLLVAVFGNSGLRLSVMDENGVTVSTQEVNDEFCANMLRSPAMEELCHECTRYGLQEVRRTGRNYTYRCHMGLAVTMIPIYLEDRPVAYLVFSGYRLEPENMEKLPYHAAFTDLEQTAPAIRDRYDDVPHFTETQLQEMVRMLTIMVQYLLKIGEHTRMLTELQSKSLELLSNANVREQREKKIVQNRMQDLLHRFRDEFTMDAMNHIAAVAMEENAPRTAELMRELALQTRKGRTPEATVVLGQEVEDLKRMLHLQQSMYGDRIRFFLEVDESCDPELPMIQIPFATMVELFLWGALSEREQGGELTVSLKQTPGELQVSVRDNCGAYSPEALRRMNRLQFTAAEGNGKVLICLLEELKENYSNGVYWRYSGEAGEYTALTLYLPLKGEGEG